MNAPNDARSIALAYLHACARRDLDAVAPLLAPEVRFVGPGNSVTGASAYLAVLRRIGTVWTDSRLRKVFADGEDVCLIYDLVTDTPAGAVPCVEWLQVRQGRIETVTLVLDLVSFKPAAEEIARRLAR